MTDTLTHPTTAIRLLGLPTVARLAHFARHDGPSVLLTTDERAAHFRDTGIFGAPHSFNPDLSSYHERADKVIVTVAQALRPFPANPEAYALTLRRGHSYRREQLLAALHDCGYARDGAPGFSVLGDTITLHLDAENPHDCLRLEFFGDELERLVRQRSEDARAELDSYVVTPLSGCSLDGAAWTSRLIAKLPGVVFLDAPELYAGELDEGALAWLWQHLSGREVISFGRDPLALALQPNDLVPLPYYRGKLSELRSELERWLQAGYSVSLLLKFARTGHYLEQKVLAGLACRWRHAVGHYPGEISLILAPGADGGVRDDARRELLVSEALLYGGQGGRRLRKLPGRQLSDAAQLAIGDYLIHPDHGIGRFVGLEPRTVLGVTRDYLMLQYAGEGKLYLPVELLPLLRRHPGTTDDPPRLSTLGTNEWARARERARISAQELALRLIRTYAERQLTQGLAMPEVPEWDELIARNCPFTLTPDQAKAVEAVYADMAKPTPMDRLISGDVGFGKTEVAVRAAHRAVGNGRQVAMLVPTTILANQHYATFRERFAGLPVRVEMLSRFSSEREAQATLEGLADGSVDIVIGTHRLLGEGVRFKALGLLIIDEEHRFGVAQKEKLKGLKANLDVLSLSATPIPRTLYMSLVGLRDVSQIMTPPAGRKPIQTVLQPYDPLAVREAVMFELERGGKCYYIHDRIGSIGMRAKTLAQLIPEARIGVAHGQMESAELEEIMLGFQEGAFDLLLSTTIVESGLDVAGANTLIIERADKLGLAQLYQLRGRVGRRETEAWAYLFYPGRITEQAQRRLYAIAELNDLGSGHLLAEKDMEIRGIGNLLGPEQHGHVSAVSLEVYTELLAEEIAKLKGETPAEARPAAAIDLAIDARLSPSYIQDDEARIAYYGRLSEASRLAEVGHIARELRERYGPMPDEVKAFIELVRLRLLATSKGVASIKEHMTDVQLSFHQSALDYDAKQLKALPFYVEATRYPPGFSIKKRGLGGLALLTAIAQVLYLCA